MVVRDRPASIGAFDAARAQVRSAAAARRGLLGTWNRLDGHDAFDVRVNVEQDGSGELWAFSDMPADVALLLEEYARVFLTSVKAAMDAAVVATAETVCTPLRPIEAALHRMPLCEVRAEFDLLVAQGNLLGLRPDQVRVLQDLQPYQAGDKNRDYIGAVMTHLAGGLAAAATGRRLVCAWATNYQPEFQLPDGALVDTLTVQAGGLLAQRTLLAEFQIVPSEGAVTTRVRPNVAFDPVLNAPPWPTSLDDNLSARTSGLLVIARRLIEGLERSVSTPTFIQQFGRLDDLAPAFSASVWFPVQFEDAEQEAQARAGIAQSDLSLASYRSDDGTYTLLRLDGDSVVGREVPEATPPEPTVALGAGVEQVTLAAAAALGLPDFVFRPEVVSKGSGLREIGDGTLVAAGRGIALQVKARDGATDKTEREISWLRKKAGEGLRQAHGSIRSTLTDPNLTLTNLRGRVVRLPGDTIEWVSVVVLDHPSPPHGVIPDLEPGKRGLVLLRRDWEFLWDQLRSVAAIVDYAHRVADDGRIPLGTEADRYFDLADKDDRAEPEPAASWVATIGAAQTSEPRLPREPADTRDAFGHAVFHQILEDIAATDFAGDEQTRLEVLALIDQVAVAHRAELGRTLLRRIDHCALAPADTLLAQHRSVLIDGGRLHLAFSVYSQYTGYHRQLYETWLLLRRQQFLQVSGAEGPEYPWSVGVLLTPRADGHRLWDTTVFATNKGPAYDKDEVEELAKMFHQRDGVDPAII